MARRTEFRCDVCEDARFVDVVAGHPDGWAHVEVSLSGLSNMIIPKDSLFKEYDLCGACQQKLYFCVEADSWSG